MTKSRAVEDSRGRGKLRTVEGSDETPTEYHFVIEVERMKTGKDRVDGLVEIQACVAVDQNFALNAMLGDTLSGDGLLIARTGHALHDKGEPAHSVSS